ncbi:MAG TPA: hypothetical protein VGM88_02125 [Kofleriaceae bacterium]
MQAGDTQTNLLKRLSRALRDNTPKPLTLVFITSGSCTNITAIYTGVPITATLQYAPSIAENPTWTPDQPMLTCTPPDGGKLPDIANSALFNSACTQDPPPSTVELIEGPRQAYVLAVPRQSSQIAITFEEAYFVFGFGQPGMIDPWVDETEMFIRTVTKSTLLAWAANISVPADKWHGVRYDGSPMVQSALETAATPEAAIGILGAEVYDADRAKLKSLAFRAKDQTHAFWPDSSPTSFDKKALRDGHYTVWSPTIWMDAVDANNTPTNADARYIIDLIAGRVVTPAQNFGMIDIISAVGLVPICAMGVQRSFEGGPLSLYKPAESCVCKYESLVDTSACAPCSDTLACTSGVCRNGLCEAN